MEKKTQGTQKETPKTKRKTTARKPTAKKTATRKPTAQDEKTAKNKENFLKAYTANLATNITQAAKGANIDRTTYYHWRKTDKEFDAKCTDIEEGQIDFAETALFMAIRNGDVGAIKFYLQTKGKKRGYGNTVEVTGAEGKDLVPNISIQIIDDKKDVEESEG